MSGTRLTSGSDTDRALAAFYFLYYGALGVFTPYFARWLQGIDFSPIAVSATLALWYATRIIAPPFWARLAARTPQPLRLLHFGAFAATAAFASFIVVRETWLVALAMAMFSFFYNAIMPQFEALTLLRLGARRSHYGRIRAWGSIGFLLTATLSGPWFDAVGYPWLPATMLALLLASAVATLPQSDLTGDRAEMVQHAGIRELLLRTDVRAFFLIALLVQIGFGPFYVFYTIHLSEAGHGGSVIGALWGLGVLAEIGVFAAMPRVFQRISARQVLQLSLIATVLRWAIVAAVPESLAWMAAAQLVHALSFAAFHAAVMQVLAEFFPGSLATQGQSILYGFSSGVGGVLGALMAGAGWQLGGGALAFALAAVVAALALPLLHWVRWHPGHLV